MPKFITVRALRSFTYRNNTYRRGDLVAMEPIDIAVRGRKGDVSKEKLSAQTLKAAQAPTVQEPEPPPAEAEAVQETQAAAPEPEAESPEPAPSEPESDSPSRRRRYRRRDLIADDPQAEPPS